MYRRSHSFLIAVSAALTLFSVTLLRGRAADKPAAPEAKPDLWVLKPVVRPAVPTGLTNSQNPIDAFVAAQYKEKGLAPVGPADKRTLLRRVYLDLIGIPPTPAEQDAFINDESAD